MQRLLFVGESLSTARRRVSLAVAIAGIGIGGALAAHAGAPRGLLLVAAALVVFPAKLLIGRLVAPEAPQQVQPGSETEQCCAKAAGK
jgi:hypothetical protein